MGLGTVYTARHRLISYKPQDHNMAQAGSDPWLVYNWGKGME